MCLRENRTILFYLFFLRSVKAFLDFPSVLTLCHSLLPLLPSFLSLFGGIFLCSFHTLLSLPVSLYIHCPRFHSTVPTVLFSLIHCSHCHVFRESLLGVLFPDSVFSLPGFPQTQFPLILFPHLTVPNVLGSSE